MSTRLNVSEAMYEVVVNEEGQYSIWPMSKVLPHGWTNAGKHGSKASCLAYITDVWRDMRPASLVDDTRNARQR